MQQRLFQLQQGGSGFDTEFLAQDAPGLPQRGQGVALAVAGPQCQGQEPPALLVKRLLPGQRPRVGERLRGLPAALLGPGEPLAGGAVQLLQAGALACGPRLVRELGVRLPAPRRERPGQALGGDVGRQGPPPSRRPPGP
nr:MULTISPECIES: hypothetical protein [Streptomyces]